MQTDHRLTDLSVGWRWEDGYDEVDGGEELPQLDAHLAHVLQVMLGLMTLQARMSGYIDTCWVEQE